MLAVCAIAAIVLYRAPYSASGLEPAPDAVEYALAGHRLARVIQLEQEPQAEHEQRGKLDQRDEDDDDHERHDTRPRIQERVAA